MVNSVTVLRARKGLNMTKVFSGDTVTSYDRAKYLKPESHKVSNIRELSALLQSLESMPDRCIIRGDFNESAPMLEDEDVSVGKGYYLRKKALYTDNPKHWCMIDIDGFQPEGVNAALDPETAVRAYIAKHLPECFHDVTVHWQLSASAGTPGKEHILKAHLWYWLDEAYDSKQMTVWAKTIGHAVDCAPFRTVQVHYTANPLFIDGAEDPVPVRSGLMEGWLGDSVPLKLDEVLLLRALETPDVDEDFEFIDPREKSGPIGAFHRAFTFEDCLERWLSEEFEFEPGSERRVTWFNGGGTPGGCFLTEDRMHLGNVHNTDPLDNRATNLFDLVRHYQFGHLDEGMDAFELLEMAARPSYQAMLDLCESLPEVRAELEQERAEEQETAICLRDRLAERIRGAVSESELRSEVCIEVQRHYKELDKLDLTLLANAVKTRMKELGQGAIRLDDARAILVPPRRELRQNGNLPGWAEDYVYVTSRSSIFRYDSDEWLSREAFDFKHNPDAGRDEDGNQLSAYCMLRDSRGVTRVEQALYMPQMDATFTLGGNLCVNTYRPSSVPVAKAPENWSDAEAQGIARIQRHLSLFCSEREELVTQLVDWLAFNVQFPGIKISYSWLLVGGEGVGKTWIGHMLGTAMGSANVRVVSGQEIMNPTFNGWAEGSALAVIEEVRVHGHKQDAWDNLKAPLSNSVVTVVRKGVDGYNVPNTTNYLMFSNHIHDAVPLTLGSRRIATIRGSIHGDKTAQLLEEMARGEGFADADDYFDALFAVLDNHPEAVRGWLLHWRITEGFNHKGRAPETKERRSMIHSTRSSEEEAVRDAISSGSLGVSESVVSPKYLHTLLSLEFDSLLTPERLSFELRKLGYSKFEGQVKWRNQVLRLWIKDVELSGDLTKDRETLRLLLEKTDHAGLEEEAFLK